ncbi:MAG: hypothetical protein V7727_00175 [Sneathiella sp.]
MVRMLGIMALVMCFWTAGSVEVRAASAPAEEGAADGPFYLEMDPLSVPIRKKSGAIKYYMFLAMSMEFDDQDKKRYSRKMLPRLRDAFLQDLSGHSVLHKDKSRGLDFAQVRKRLLKHAKKVLGKNAPTSMHVVKVFKGN